METEAAAYALYREDCEVKEVVRLLNCAGFLDEHICLMFPPTHPIAALVRDASVFNDEREASPASAGWIRWLSGLGAVIIPTVGFFIRSQAFLHALLVAKDEPARIGDTATLVRLGFPDEEAERVEDFLEGSGFLVYVASTASRMRWALEILRFSGGETAALGRCREVVAVA